MKLTVNEQRDLLKQFPKFELSYEKKLHKKVHSDICLTIPKGKKFFAWFKTYKRNNYCFLLQIDKRHNSIENISIISPKKVTMRNNKFFKFLWFKSHHTTIFLF